MLFICVVTKMAFCMYAGALVLQSRDGLGDHAERADHGGNDRRHYDDRRVWRSGLHRRHPFAHHDRRFGDGPVHRPAQARGLGRPVRGRHAHAGARRHAHPQAWTDPTYPFWGIILGAIYGGTFYWGIDQVNVQRMLGPGTWNRPAGARCSPCC